MPYGLHEPRQPIILYINIYHAFILVKHEKGILNQFKSNLFGSFIGAETSSTNKAKCESDSTATAANQIEADTIVNISQLNPYVKVTFDGETKQTPVLTATDNPTWNYCIEFNHLYPPLVRMIRIDLCTQDSSQNERILGSEYMSVNDISSYVKDDYFLPTYGPR